MGKQVCHQRNLHIIRPASKATAYIIGVNINRRRDESGWYLFILCISPSVVVQDDRLITPLNHSVVAYQKETWFLHSFSNARRQCKAIIIMMASYMLRWARYICLRRTSTAYLYIVGNISCSFVHSFIYWLHVSQTAVFYIGLKRTIHVRIFWCGFIQNVSQLAFDYIEKLGIDVIQFKVTMW